MSLGDELSDMLRDHLEPEVGSPTITLNGISIPCMPSSESRGNLVTEGGLEVAIDFSVTIRKNALPTAISTDSTVIYADSSLPVDSSTKPPAPGSTIKYPVSGHKYKVVRVTTLPGNTIIELDLVDISK